MPVLRVPKPACRLTCSRDHRLSRFVFRVCLPRAIPLSKRMHGRRPEKGDQRKRHADGTERAGLGAGRTSMRC